MTEGTQRWNDLRSTRDRHVALLASAAKQNGYLHDSNLMDTRLPGNRRTDLHHSIHPHKTILISTPGFLQLGINLLIIHGDAELAIHVAQSRRCDAAHHANQ